MLLILCIGGLSIYELYEILELKREILILKQETGAVYLEPKVRIRNAQNANEYSMHMLIYFISLSQMIRYSRAFGINIIFTTGLDSKRLKDVILE
jgi:hypothetical protein